MALQLMKISIDGTIDTNVEPDSAKFFYVTTAETAAGDTLIVDAGDFLQDDGSTATELPDLATDNSYYTVYINGVEQMQGLSTYTPGATGTGSLEIQVPAGGPSIKENSPVVLHIVNFTPSSSGTFET
ncbi:DUF4183 domain-containing protein [Lentibacillus cibarius]|uniref:DUF4183 domain-containing protein n=1 Tax=Lentibacillus cibarius TaxID=2583219 RepID=A0A5S3QMQ8_9BACI|nr:DUF4183 domain-containing protein [Lentibacillus cibarius]TMN23244.1 DUF4183 domain-containing protein [Lentibacillus cibarius]